ncbi:calcitonin gene-related peptide type 1 receptor-like [Mya arenaria]|uniref:calcitonin gene-related peptide type 1 receptor-like n=1 Tax=Mya arenaria TaxID=6604 RepID=UPI0022E698A0|nr:calcitonin gene-related peptide type 1 receptor-like [Mya arenaria]
MAVTSSYAAHQSNIANVSDELQEQKKINAYHPRLQQIIDELKSDCMKKHSSQPQLAEEPLYCNRTVDNFVGCWPDTLPGQTAKIQCPSLPGFNLDAFAYRECTRNGTWFVNQTTGQRWANYSECYNSHSPEDDTKHIYIFIGGFSLSLLMLVVSLIIFFRFRQLRCDRITIHKNLFLSYVFTGISWILYYVLAALDGEVLLYNPLWCQALHIMCQYFTVCNFLWMFCEGLYLNTIMVYAFSSGKILIISCYIIGWGIPVVLTLVYTLVRGSDDYLTMDCWINESALQWIMYGPIVLSIGVNVLFLVNIVRLLITKLRQMPEADQTRKATRATLILVPLLGLQYLLFPIRPEPGSKLQDVYHTSVALLISLQGAFVSTMYCFCNGEVIQVLRRKWNQHKLMSRSSLRASGGPGATYTTMDPVTQTQASYFSTAENKDPPMEMGKMESLD